MIIPEKGQFSFDEVWAKVKKIQRKQTERLLTKEDVEKAIELRERSARVVVLAWGGFVPCEPGDIRRKRIHSTKLILFYSGKIQCSRNKSCGRVDVKEANKIFATGPLFGILYPHLRPTDMPFISDEGKLEKPLSRAELLDIMLKNREYGQIVRHLQENNMICDE